MSGYQISQVISKSIDKLCLTGIEKVELGRRFNNEAWLLDGYLGCIDEYRSSLSLADIGEVLGWQTAAKLAEIALTSGITAHGEGMGRIQIPVSELMRYETGGATLGKVLLDDGWNKQYVGVVWLPVTAPCIAKKAQDMGLESQIREAFKEEFGGGYQQRAGDIAADL